MSWQKWYDIFLKEQEDFLRTAPNVSPSHRTDHILRVWETSKELGKGFDCDMETLVAAVLLHDLGRHHVNGRHGEKSAELARPILERHGFPKEKIPAVLEAIRQHDYHGEQEKMRLIESKILNDADRKDVFGVIGVYRHVLFINAGRMKLEDVIPMSERRWKSLALPESRELLKADYEYIVSFFKTLKEELGKG